MTRDITTKQAVRHLLARGLATKSECARLAGRSRQLIALWAQGLDDRRAEYLKLQWRKALNAVKASTKE